MEKPTGAHWIPGHLCPGWSSGSLLRAGGLGGAQQSFYSLSIMASKSSPLLVLCSVISGWSVISNSPMIRANSSFRCWSCGEMGAEGGRGHVCRAPVWPGGISISSSALCQIRDKHNRGPLETNFFVLFLEIGVHCVALADFELRDPHASSSQVLARIKACASTT